jgi:DNA-binding transcriptional LysR family regulator
MTDNLGPDPTLLQLRSFLAIVETGSFAEAGRRLGLSASVVSKTIARLEVGHGVKLLHRSTHAVSPTDEGLALIEPAREATRALVEVSRFLDHAAERTGGTVRLTAPVAFMRHCLTPMLTALRRLHPDIRFDLRASNALLDLAEHGVDLAIRTGPLDNVPGHVPITWFTFPWVVCAAPAYLDGRRPLRTPADLADHDLIGFRATEDGLVRAWTFREPGTEARLRIAPEPIAVFDDGETGWRAALDGLGIARAPLFLAAGALREGRMVEVLRPWRDDDMLVSILRRETRLTPARVETVIAFLRGHPPSLQVD